MAYWNSFSSAEAKTRYNLPSTMTVTDVNTKYLTDKDFRRNESKIIFLALPSINSDDTTIKNTIRSLIAQGKIYSAWDSAMFFQAYKMDHLYFVDLKIRTEQINTDLQQQASNTPIEQKPSLPGQTPPVTIPTTNGTNPTPETITNTADPSSGGSPKKKGLSTGALIGIIGGGVLVLGAVTFLIIRKK